MCVYVCVCVCVKLSQSAGTFVLLDVAVFTACVVVLPDQLDTVTINAMLDPCAPV